MTTTMPANFPLHDETKPVRQLHHGNIVIVVVIIIIIVSTTMKYQQHFPFNRQ
jgi:hypothetical protein